MESDQWSFWLLAWARGHFLWSKNEVVKQLSMNTCPTFINSTHTAQQPCRHNSQTPQLKLSALGSTEKGFSHHQVHLEFGPTRKPSLLTPLPIIHAESWSGLEYGSLGTSRSSLAGAGLCFTQPPKTFPGFVESWPLLLFCPQPRQSDGGGKSLNSLLLKNKRKVLGSQGHRISPNCAFRQTQVQQQETHPGKAQPRWDQG